MPKRDVTFPLLTVLKKKTKEQEKEKDLENEVEKKLEKEVEKGSRNQVFFKMLKNSTYKVEFLFYLSRIPLFK